MLMYAANISYIYSYYSKCMHEYRHEVVSCADLNVSSELALSAYFILAIATNLKILYCTTNRWLYNLISH